MADTKDKKESSENLPIKAHTFGKLTFRVFLIALVLGGGYAFWKNPNLSNDVSAKVKSFFESSNSESEMPQIDQVALLRQEVNDLRTQIALMQSLQAQKQDTAALEKRFETLEKFNQNVIDSKADVSIVLGLLTRLDKVEQQLDVLSKITDQGAVILTATMMVKDAAERGGSFIYEAEVLNQLATVATPDNQTLTVTVWDINNAGAVEKAIRDSGLGLNPMTAGGVIRLNMPPLTEERRKELTKVAGKYAEEAKISMRNIRQDAMGKIKRAVTDKEISEDDQRKFEDDLQKVFDAKSADVDTLAKQKEADIMSV